MAALAAVPIQGGLDRRFHAGMHSRRAAQVAATLLRQAGRQVAGTRLTVHGLASSRQPETLLGCLMGFDFGLSFGFGHFKIAFTKIRDVSGSPWGLR